MITCLRYLRDKHFTRIYDKMDGKVDESDCKDDMDCLPKMKEDIATNSADINWLKWGLRLLVGGLITGTVGIGYVYGG